MINDEKETGSGFWKLLKNNQRYDFVVAACTIIAMCIPPVIQMINDKDIEFKKALIESIPYLFFIHIIFFIIVLYRMGKSPFILNLNKRPHLYSYVQRTFTHTTKEQVMKQNVIAKYKEDELFNSINTTIRQFYYGWVIIWLLWLIMYVNKFIYTLLTPDIPGVIVNPFLIKLSFLIDNGINSINSVFFLFIYFVLSESSTKETRKINKENNEMLKFGFIILAFTVISLMIMDFYSCFSEKYATMQFWIKLVIGIIATFSIVAVFGKLNSSFLKIPQTLMLLLYIYAASQMLNPFIHKEIFGNKVYDVELLGSILFLVAFIGKVCLFIVIQFIFNENRFVFFILQKSDSFYSSKRMFDEFKEMINVDTDADKKDTE